MSSTKRSKIQISPPQFIVELKEKKKENKSQQSSFCKYYPINKFKH